MRSEQRCTVYVFKDLDSGSKNSPDLTTLIPVLLFEFVFDGHIGQYEDFKNLKINLVLESESKFNITDSVYGGGDQCWCQVNSLKNYHNHHQTTSTR